MPHLARTFLPSMWMYYCFLVFRVFFSYQLTVCFSFSVWAEAVGTCSRLPTSCCWLAGPLRARGGPRACPGIVESLPPDPVDAVSGALVQGTRAPGACQAGPRLGRRSRRWQEVRGDPWVSAQPPPPAPLSVNGPWDFCRPEALSGRSQSLKNNVYLKKPMALSVLQTRQGRRSVTQGDDSLSQLQ